MDETVTDKVDENVREAVQMPDKADEEIREAVKGPKNRALLEIIIYVIFAILFVKLVPEYVFERVSVDGESMCNTLQDGDQLIGGKISVHLHKIERYDIVYFYPQGNTNSEAFIKRIIGLPGETVQIVDSVIYINGEPIDDPYAAEPEFEGYMAEDVITLGEDEYFVLGDNRNHSSDSRRQAVGIVDYEDIIGKAVFRIWPLSSFGSID